MEEKPKVKRSRNGCHKCKRHKIKCDEAKPSCSYCLKTDSVCDYSMKLTWGGRPFKNKKKNGSLASVPDPSLTEPVLVQFVNQNPRKRTNETQINGAKRRNISTPRDIKDSSFITRNGDSILSEIEKTRNDTLENIRLMDRDFDRKQYFPYLQTRSLLAMPQVQVRDIDGVHDVYSRESDIRHIQPMQNPMILSLQQVAPKEELQIDQQMALTPPSGQNFVSNPQNKSSLDFDALGSTDFHQNVEHISAEHTSKSPGDFLSDYSEDLARIERYMPDAVPYTDFSPPSNIYNQIFGYNKRIAQVSDDEDSELDEEIQLDEEDIIRSEVDVLTPNEIFSCMPQPLLLPLPDVLLKVPFYRNLMHFWVNIACHHFVPAPSEVYRDNPFKVILPQMATSHPAILTSLLAFAAKLRVQILGEKVDRNAVIEQLLARSFTELLLLLKDKEKATSDTTLATVLLLACYEIFDNANFERHRAHAIGARQIIKVRHLNMPTLKSNRSPTESDITFFLMRWFVYMDVMGAISASKVSTNYLSPEEVKLRGDVSGMMANVHQSDSENDPKKDIDHLLGFDAKLLPHFANIASLISETDQFLETPDADVKAIPISIVVKALEVKDNLTKEYEKGEERRKQKLDAIIDDKIQQKKQSGLVYSPPNLRSLFHHNNILRCTNKMFYDMGMISLYRRVLRVPRESPIIQQLANGIGYTLRDNIVPTTPAEICTIFCLFTAACETLDTDLQKFFDGRFSSLLAMGNLNAMKGQQVMRRCWETGQDWVSACKSLKIDIALM